MKYKRQDIKKYYDLTGKFQDSQSFYEKPAENYLLRTLHFGTARHIVELGSGTGSFAQTLLSRCLPLKTRYTGFDVSSTMVEMASKKIQHFGPRAQVYRVDACKSLPLKDNSIDVMFANFFLDLLPGEDIKRIISNASQYLKKGGLLCIANITYGTSGTSKYVMKVWQLIHGIAPFSVGYCRPVDLGNYLSGQKWRSKEYSYCSYGIEVQVIVNKLH